MPHIYKDNKIPFKRNTPNKHSFTLSLRRKESSSSFSRYFLFLAARKKEYRLGYRGGTELGKKSRMRRNTSSRLVLHACMEWMYVYRHHHGLTSPSSSWMDGWMDGPCNLSWSALWSWKLRIYVQTYKSLKVNSIQDWWWWCLVRSWMNIFRISLQFIYSKERKFSMKNVPEYSKIVRRRPSRN